MLAKTCSQRIKVFAVRLHISNKYIRLGPKLHLCSFKTGILKYRPWGSGQLSLIVTPVTKKSVTVAPRRRVGFPC